MRYSYSKYLLVCTSAFIFTGNAKAADCFESDCSALGFVQTQSECSGYSSLRCPYDLSKYFCSTDVCADVFKYACTGAEYKNGYGTPCNGKYVQCTCNDGYTWNGSSCVKKADSGSTNSWNFTYQIQYRDAYNPGYDKAPQANTFVYFSFALYKKDGTRIDGGSYSTSIKDSSTSQTYTLASDLEYGDYMIALNLYNIPEGYSCLITHVSFDGTCYANPGASGYCTGSGNGSIDAYGNINATVINDATKDRLMIVHLKCGSRS